MIHEGIEFNEITIALIGVILTGIGVIIVFLFNIKALTQNSKNNEYQMMRDFFDTFHKIQSISADKPSSYLIESANFCLMVFALYKQGIVKKNIILEQLPRLFEESVWIYKQAESLGKDAKELFEWCKKNKLSSTPIVKARLDHIKKINITAAGGIKVEIKTP